jgi:hypothetical protein
MLFEELDDHSTVCQIIHQIAKVPQVSRQPIHAVSRFHCHANPFGNPHLGRFEVIRITVGEELCMGLRPTYMDEDRREPKRYDRTGAGRLRPSRLWIS